MKVVSRSKLATEVNERGFAFLPSNLPESTTMDAIAGFGTIEKLPGMNEIQELTPKNAADYPPNMYSGNFGYSDFPFHTDLAHWFQPPQYLVLRCVEGTNDVKTRLLDSTEIVQTLGEDSLRRALVRPRRPIEMKRSLLRIVERCGDGRSRFRWDSLFIVPATNYSSQMCVAVGKSIAAIKSLDFVLEHPGDTLILDNWRILHGRTAVPPSQRNRKVHRAYLSTLK
jgi:L-asparagine oxygenase